VTSSTSVVIVGAGPYGLSIAAHLAARGIAFRIFGSPMGTWRTQMPIGMMLKSEGFASSLYDPEGQFSLEKYCKSRGIPYAPVSIPVPLEVFCDYGQAFQRRYVPMLEERMVTRVEGAGSGFLVTLDCGDTVLAGKVIVAAGIAHFDHMPAELERLGPDYATHSVKHRDLSPFRDRSVGVIGAGASAANVAALVHAAGGFPVLVARRAKIDFHNPPERTKRGLYQRLRAPRSGLGTGWKSRLSCDLPLLFHFLPQQFRLAAVRRHLGPAPGWTVKDAVTANVPLHTSCQIASAEVVGDRVGLTLAVADGTQRTLTVDHVIAATGYRCDLRRLPFLTEGLLDRVRTVENTPVLSSHFESSIPGLYFVGTVAANSFGPLLRFAFGARFTARRLTAALAKSARAPLPLPASSTPALPPTAVRA
jgi:thioredoxin reductase